MKEITFEESKLIMIDTLKSIDKCCRENNINYSLAWGSLIGAVRHHGFVPWDDDIDLMMSRDNYNRFLQLYDDPRFSIYTPNKDKNCIQLLTKVYRKDTKIFFNFYKKKSLFGLWISIFPYDNAPDEGLEKWDKKRAWLFRLYHYKVSLYLDRKPILQSYVSNMVKFFLKIPVMPFSSFYLAKKIERHLSIFNHKKTQNICIWDTENYTKYLFFPSELFDEFEEVDFEGVKCLIIKGYDTFLRMFYGDYMQLPPKEKRVPSHNFKAYYVNEE